MSTALRANNISPIHPFPARMAPSIVWECLPSKGRRLRVLDPMAGSGTTLVCARAKGHQAIGCDTDPLALLIAKAWCSDVDRDGLRYRGDLVLKRARKLGGRLTPNQAYPSHADKETREFLDFWFDSHNRIELAALSKCVSRLHDSNEKTLLWCALSRLIITKNAGASLAIDISHSRPHRKFQFAPVRPFDKFGHAVNHIIQKSPFQNGFAGGPAAVIRHGDARKLPIRANSVDMMITSPPYLNAIDYIRGHKFSLVWMGYPVSSLRSVRSSNIGAERSADDGETELIRSVLEKMGSTSSLDQRHRSMIVRYIGDMGRVLSEIKRVMRKNGHAVIVIGDSTIRGVFIKNSELLIHLALSSGLRLISKSTRALPDSRRYLPPPNTESSGKELQGRMKEEVVLTFAHSS